MIRAIVSNLSVDILYFYRAFGLLENLFLGARSNFEGSGEWPAYEEVYV
jgi:hypothetical protein